LLGEERRGEERRGGDHGGESIFCVMRSGKARIVEKAMEAMTFRV
jgi:hypothetical protein